MCGWKMHFDLKMNLIDDKPYLLTCLNEEAAEIIQDGCKAQRFGLDSDYAGEKNSDKLITELNQLVAVADLLFPEGWQNDQIQDNKKDKLEQYYKINPLHHS